MGAECMQGLKFQYLEVYVNFYDILESLSAILPEIPQKKYRPF